MSKRKGLREIEYGYHAGGQNKTCIYDNGHIEPAAFLIQVREMRGSDVPADARAALQPEDVQHLRFRPMSPSEARSWGSDYGVIEAEEGRGYPVTAVIL